MEWKHNKKILKLWSLKQLSAQSFPETLSLNMQKKQYQKTASKTCAAKTLWVVWELQLN